MVALFAYLFLWSRIPLLNLTSSMQWGESYGLCQPTRKANQKTGSSTVCMWSPSARFQLNGSSREELSLLWNASQVLLMIGSHKRQNLLYCMALVWLRQFDAYTGTTNSHSAPCSWWRSTGNIVLAQTEHVSSELRWSISFASSVRCNKQAQHLAKRFMATHMFTSSVQTFLEIFLNCSHIAKVF